MMGFWSSQDVMSYLVKGLDASSLRQRVHSHNLANLNTPGFKRSYVEFEEILKSAMAGSERSLAVTRENHIPARGGGKAEPRTVKDTATSMRPDGNNVDVDKEMTLLAINQLYYDAVSQQLSDRLGMIRYVINEGRR